MIEVLFFAFPVLIICFLSTFITNLLFNNNSFLDLRKQLYRYKCLKEMDYFNQPLERKREMIRHLADEMVEDRY